MEKYGELRIGRSGKKQHGKSDVSPNRFNMGEEVKRYHHEDKHRSHDRYNEGSKEIDEAIQLVEIDDKGTCKLNPIAMDIIKGIKTKIGVISVVGPYRTGKSFLLNRLLGQQDGFEIGPTVQSCTRGIWIWGKPVKISDDMHVILMDTEGLGSCNRTMNIDIKIFTLSVLLSSMFVYNCLNAIDENALEVLSLVVNLTKYISSQQKKDESGVYNQANYSPYFMWVVRDFSLQMMPADELEKAGHDPATYWDKLSNQEQAAKEYLEESLQGVNLGTVNEENKKTVMKKNEIRKAIKNFFHQREAT